MSHARIFSYDVFRGVLLIGMVVFHVLANLTRVPFNQELFYWVPLGFIMFLGVVLGRFLRNRSAKKIQLGGKLLLIFLLLNIPNFLQKDFSFLTLLKGDATVFSFEILLPMALLILSSIALDKLSILRKTTLVLLFGGLILLKYFGIFYYNLSFLIYGLIGYFLGVETDLDRWLKTHKTPQYVALFVVMAIAPFLLIQFVGLYDFILLFQVVAMYFLANVLFADNRTLVWLGKNSLWLYVIHIFVIKGISQLISYAS